MTVVAACLPSSRRLSGRASHGVLVFTHMVRTLLYTGAGFLAGAVAGLIWSALAQAQGLRVIFCFATVGLVVSGVAAQMRNRTVPDNAKFLKPADIDALAVSAEIALRVLPRRLTENAINKFREFLSRRL